MPNLSEVRRQAWATRRTKYGQHGHKGSYSRCHCAANERMQALLIRLLAEGALSEGQVAKATGLHRTEIRRLEDVFNLAKPSPHVTRR